MWETKSLGINVHLVQTDLRKLDTIESTFAEAASYAKEAEHQKMILLLNMGTVDIITKATIEITYTQSSFRITTSPCSFSFQNWP